MISRFKLFLFLTLIPLSVTSQDIYKSNRTFTHKEAILKYNALTKAFPDRCKLVKGGDTDCGRPLHLFIINKDGVFAADSIDRSSKTVVFILNAIHPGEPCGVDACVRLSREYVRNVDSLPDNVVLCIVPMYNIGGGTNRNCCSRANQEGPLEYGFRGNAQNLDLNRDFVKMDSKNALAFATFFRTWNPDIFIDTHTSNGADYQHVMTLITTQTDKLNHVLSNYVVNKMRPELFRLMEKDGFPMSPYVHSINKIPDNGIKDYLETPRYSTGYAAAFNTIAFVSEAHMLKPYDQRVESTYSFVKNVINYASVNVNELIELKENANLYTSNTDAFEFNYILDTSRHDTIDFLGYKAKYKPSGIGDHERLYYDRTEPLDMQIPYYRYYKPTLEITKPNYYIVPQSWHRVIERLQLNGIEMNRLKNDTSIVVSAYRINAFETIKKPFEGHYLHYNTQVEKDTFQVNLYRGDYIVPMYTANDLFIMEVLEPQCTDSYFNWNFFDAILQQKEWFSAYVFEDKAVEILEQNPDIKEAFEQKKQNDPDFANNGWAQLYYIYTQSDYYESSHNLYPVFRIEP